MRQRIDRAVRIRWIDHTALGQRVDQAVLGQRVEQGVLGQRKDKSSRTGPGWMPDSSFRR